MCYTCKNVIICFDYGLNAWSEPSIFQFKQGGLNLSSSDVAWCPNDENLIATAATNGAVVAWDLTAPRSKQLVVFSEHQRTVTKVSFHPVEAARLISGSQVI